MLLFINGDVKIRSTLRTEWVTQPKSGMTRREFHLQQILWKEPFRPGMIVSRTVFSILIWCTIDIMEIIPITTCGVPIIKQLLPMTILLTRLFTIRVPLVLNFLPVTLSQDLPQQEKVYHLPLKLTVPGVVRKKVGIFIQIPKKHRAFSSRR